MWGRASGGHARHGVWGNWHGRHGGGTTCRASAGHEGHGLEGGGTANSVFFEKVF